MANNLENLTGEALKNELARRAYDIIRVHNTTNKDYTVEWDKTGQGLRFVVPSSDRDLGFGKGNQDLPRYIATKYIEEMANKVMTEEGQKYIDSTNALRVKRGQPKLTPQEQEVEETPYRTDNPEKRLEVLKTLWLGIVREYGREELPEEAEAPRADRRPLDERLLSQIEDQVAGMNDLADQLGGAIEAEAPEVNDLEDLKENAMKGVK